VVLITELAALGKLVAPPLVRMGARRRRSWYRLIAKEVATASPYPVPTRELRKTLALPQMLTLIGTGAESDAVAAVALLRGGLGTSREWRGLTRAEIDERCSEVLLAVQKQLLHHLGLGDGLQVVDSRAATRQEEVMSSLDNITQHLDGDDLFASRLLRLPPSMFGIESLRADAPRVAELVRVVADDADRAGTLRGWLHAPPDWLARGPAALWVYMGEALQALGQLDASAAAFSKASEHGATPFGYSGARAAMLYADLSGKDEALVALAPVLEVVHPHPLALAVAASIRDDHSEAAELIAAWEPTTERDRDLAALLRCRWLVLAGEEDDAVAALEARVGVTRGGSIPLLLAQLLTSRAYRGRASAGREADLRRAVDLALRARDRARAWNGLTIDAIAIASDALILSHDPAAAWKVLRAAPDGDATPEEANNPAVRAKAALVAAGLGKTDLARELAASADDPFEVAHLTAILAEQVDYDATDAAVDQRAELWAAAFAAASTDTQRMAAARGLRALGEPVPDYDRLRSLFPEAAAETEELAGVFALPEREQMARLRASRNTTPYAAVRLAELYEKAGDLDAAATVLSEAADRFQDQQLRLAAARRLAVLNKYPEAEAEVQAALAKAPEKWAGRAPALGILLELEGVQGDWPGVAAHARQLLGLDPEDSSARWALVAALANLREYQPAWDAVQQSPVPLVPTTKVHAGLLFSLTARFGQDETVWREAVQLLRRYADDEQFCAGVLGAVYGRNQPAEPGTVDEGEDDERNEPLPPELLELHAATEEFVTRFPDSKGFRQLTFTTPEDMIAKIGAMLSPGAAERADLSREVAAGRLPSGMLCVASGRPYAEIFLRRASGAGLLLRSADPNEDGQEANDLAAVLGEAGVIIEASTLNTLTALDPALRDKLIGAHRQVLVTEDTLRDLVAARDSTAQRPTLFATFDNQLQRPVMSAIDSESAQAVAVRAQGMVAIAQRMSVMRWPQLRHFTTFNHSRELAWIGSVDAAKSTSQLLWCDDLPLRRLARSEGVTAFGTTVLLDVLVRQGLPADEREGALLALAGDWSADLDFVPERIEVVAEKAAWAPAAGAYALSRASAWRDPAGPFAVLRKAIARSEGPDAISGWMYAATSGLCTASNSPTTARENAERLLRFALAQPRIVGPYVLAAITGARAGARAHSVEDPTEGALRILHRDYLASHDESAAAQAILALAANMEQADRLLVVQIIFGPR
jgi:tetratricopeptide (TPR) repeat protein